MRKQDIKIGEEYAVSRSNDYIVKRARVISGPHTPVSRRSWENVSPYFNIEYLPDRTAGKATSREIREPWAEYEPAQKVRDEAARQARIAREAGEVQRNEQIIAIRQHCPSAYWHAGSIRVPASELLALIARAEGRES